MKIDKDLIRLQQKYDIEVRSTSSKTVKMRNLRNVRYDGWSLPTQFRERSVTAATWDLANDSVLCTLGPTENDALIELVRVDARSKSQYDPSLLL